MNGIRLVLALIFFTVSLFLGLMVGRDAMRGLHSKTWPAATASLSTGRVGRGFLAVHYDYSADGRRYAGDRIRFGYVFSTPDIRARYEGRKSATIRYSPSSPSLSVLEPGLYLNGILSESLFTLLFALAAALLFFSDPPEFPFRRPPNLMGNRF